MSYNSGDRTRLSTPTHGFYGFFLFFSLLIACFALSVTLTLSRFALRLLVPIILSLRLASLCLYRSLIWPFRANFASSLFLSSFTTISAYQT